MIGLPLYEMVRASREAEEKSQKMNDRLENIDENLGKIKDWMEKM